MRRPLFDFVEQIRSADKYFDVSRLEIQRLLLTHGKCDLLTDFEMTDSTGQLVATSLRLNISARTDTPLSWTMALKLHDVRIDGIDHEAKFDLPDGGTGHGWHRHQWDVTDESAERCKLPIDALSGISTREQFLIRGLSLLKIQLNSVDHGQGLLFA